MEEFKVLEIKQSVFADNDRQAAEMRRELKKKKVFLSKGRLILLIAMI